MLYGAVLKPLIAVWAALNVVDDLGLVFRMARLGQVLLPGGSSRTELCDVCDDVMGDLLKGSDGLGAVPCSWACLKIPSCVKMCESVKSASGNSTKFPCIAAGYCDPVDEDMADADVECSVGAFFSCQPQRYCKRKRSGLRFSCHLRPGIGRWVGMKNAVGSHASALADGLLSQPRCGEVGAGPYCIATPRGFGAAAEAIGHFISIAVGGLKTVAAIESPGGDDDRQWLTFWLILTMLLFAERFLARVVLSSFPLYYEAKLGLLMWLMFRNGADLCYRKLRAVLLHAPGVGKLLQEEELKADQEELSFVEACAPSLVEAALQEELERRASTPKRGRSGGGVRRRAGTLSLSVIRDNLALIKEEDACAPDARAPTVPEGSYYLHEEPSFKKLAVEVEQDDGYDDVSDRLYVVSTYMLSEAGGRALHGARIDSPSKGLLLERAAARVSFQPRFLRVVVVGTADEVEDGAGELPPMDGNGMADAYVTCRLRSPGGAPYPARGISTRTAFRTTRPQWGQQLEIPLSGGAIAVDGKFKSATDWLQSELLVSVHDADVGVWGWLLIFSKAAGITLAVGAVAAYVSGAADNLTERQASAVATGVAANAILLLAVAFLAFVRFRHDDEAVGACLPIPVDILMDQRQHTLLLPLRAPEPALVYSPGRAEAGNNRQNRRVSKEQKDHGKRNASGGLGVLKLRLQMSEH